jgi:hypothetical protein
LGTARTFFAADLRRWAQMGNKTTTDDTGKIKIKEDPSAITGENGD